MKTNKYIVFSFLICFSCLLLSCRSAENIKKTDYENIFFEIDFSDKSADLNRFMKQFFTTFPHNDPTQGNVIYDRTQWVNADMLKVKKGNGLYAYIKSRKDDKGFDSFRLTSKPYYNLNDTTKKIMFVFKGSLPSLSALWPAWWLNGSFEKEWLYKTGPVKDDYVDTYSGKGEFHNTASPVNCTDWPSAGEIDLIETINGNNEIHNTIHTCPNMCDSEWNDDGVIINCANSNKVDANPGCSGKSYDVDSPEGTFVCIWQDKRLEFYYWKPDANVRNEGGPLSSSPNPELWKDNLKNYVDFYDSKTDCDKEIHQEWQCNNCSGADSCQFSNMKMIFNITVCGVWAGRKFDETEKASDNCQDFIKGEGKDLINNQFIKIEYVAVSELK